nr:subclass B1 metallo-beta-lactamase [uncultured bacterium]
MRTLLFTLFFLTGGVISARQIKPKLEIHPLTGDFYIYTTYGDPGDGSLYPANGMYLVTQKGVVLFDTPWDTTQFKPLLDSIRTRHGKNVVMCIATHFHEDRTAALVYYAQQNISTYTTKRTDDLCIARNKPRAEYLINGDTAFHIGQYSFEVYYPGKGHSPDNIVIWFGKEKILYGGCFIKSTETESVGNLSDADIDEWIRSVKRVQKKCGSPAFIIPGHLGWSSKRSLTHTLAILEHYRKKNNR